MRHLYYNHDPPSFPPPRSLKCQIIGRMYVRSFCTTVSPHFFPIHRLLFLNRERLDRFLLSLPSARPRTDACRFVSLMKANATPLMSPFLIRLPGMR
ncbi:hypothetical protein PUN28_014732 [Cardiocondyla obscurior]|uniref:Uncharacterized protein n=1 Tax=Cardiocondyla obscurior TaxID=286306 RepID=A0AAW2EV58_9HYME